MDTLDNQQLDLESPDDVALADRMKAGREQIISEIKKQIIGQDDVIHEILLTLFVGGNSLIVGVPGLAKTLIIRTMAQVLDLNFNRIQFTPDLMPSDITGTDIIQEDAETGGRKMVFAPGPVFTNILLADEINRTPPKTQSALLESMQEHRVTVQGRTYTLEEPFFVFATQNPIELEGTYPLPEAQIDRFLVKLVVPYPTEEDERAIVERDAEPEIRVEAIANADTVRALRTAARAVHVAGSVSEYAVRLARATRDPGGAGVGFKGTGSAQGVVALGASPRASIYLIRASRARALIDGRQYVTPYDVKRVAPDVLRHRVVVSYEAEADGIDSENIVDAVLTAVETP